MIALTALMIILALRLFPDLLFAQALRMWLVERPIAWLSTASRRHVILAVIVITLVFMPETVVLLGAADLSIMAFALDVSLYIDAAIALAVLGILFHVTAVRYAVVDVVMAAGRRCRRAVFGLPRYDDEAKADDKLKSLGAEVVTAFALEPFGPERR